MLKQSRLKVFSSVFLILLILLGMGVEGVDTATAADQPPPAPALVTSNFPGADNVTIGQDCLSDGFVRLRLGWTAYNLGIQFVDLSLFNNGWFPGTFLGAGPLFPAQNNLVWDGLLPGATHFVRVNTLTAFGWQPSPTFSFFTRADCFRQPPCLPFTPGPCPIPPPPPTPPSPPPGRCVPNAPAILIFPPVPGVGGCVIVSPFLRVGEPVVFCYSVTQPMFVRIVVFKPDGTSYEVVNGFDDGRGDCLSPGAAGLPRGTRTVFMYGGLQSASQLFDQTSFTVR
jgi:hypothetical protein